jgi:hypothetical protein
MVLPTICRPVHSAPLNAATTDQQFAMPDFQVTPMREWQVRETWELSKKRRSFGQKKFFILKNLNILSYFSKSENCDISEKNISFTDY